MTASLWLLQANDAGKELGAINAGIMDYLKLVLVLALILALAFVVLRLGLPRIAGVHSLAPGVIQVAARYPLEPRKHLYVIRVGEEYCLVGTSESGMQYLTALASGQIEATLAKTATPQDHFPSLLQRVRPRKRPS